MVRSDGSWKSNTDYICKRTTKKCWILHRLKELEANTDDLLQVYQRQMRSILEFGCPAWHSGLTKGERRRIEREQKKAFAIILGPRYHSYKQALETLDQKTLEFRREELTLKFAVKCLKNKNRSDMFPLLDKGRRPQGSRKKYREYFCRTKRYFKSAIPYMTRLLNQNQCQ